MSWRPLAASLQGLRRLLCAELRLLSSPDAAAMLDMLNSYSHLRSSPPSSKADTPMAVPLLPERVLLLERLGTLEGHMAALTTIAIDMQVRCVQ